MSEEKLGQHYLAALNEAFPGVVLDHAWQTKDQLTVRDAARSGGCVGRARSARYVRFDSGWSAG